MELAVDCAWLEPDVVPEFDADAIEVDIPVKKKEDCLSDGSRAVFWLSPYLSPHIFRSAISIYREVLEILSQNRVDATLVVVFGNASGARLDEWVPASAEEIPTDYILYHRQEFVRNAQLNWGTNIRSRLRRKFVSSALISRAASWLTSQNSRCQLEVIRYLQQHQKLPNVNSVEWVQHVPHVDKG